MLRTSIISLSLCAVVSAQSFAADSLGEAISLAKTSHSSSAKSQKKIDDLSGQAQRVVSDYLVNKRQADITEAYNAQLSKLITSQQREIADIQEQIASIEETEQAMLPLLNVMVDDLSSFVTRDLPFLPEERASRVEKLTSLLDRADVSVAEKYRQVLEAYLVEVGYGRTIEAYSSPLLADDSGTHVNYLRMGRVALYYQSLNGHESGVWLPTQGTWQTLDSEQNLVLTKALQIAQQQRVPELLALPIPNTPN